MKAAIMFLLIACAMPAMALDPLSEVRYCGAPARNADGAIRRRADVIAAFRALYPCPVTKRTTGACPGWAIDHTIPLAVGGCDAVANMQWLPISLKSCRIDCKDRWERKVYLKNY